MKQFVKGLLYRVAPQWTTAVQSARGRAHSHRMVASWGGGPLTKKLLERFGDRVLAGPFAGVTLTPSTHAEQVGPYLLGLYEKELDAAWETVFRGSYTQVLDVGAKFGFYAVGLAKRYPAAEVVAFDTDWWARGAVREMAAANGTANVRAEGFCSPDWLAAHTKDGAFVLSDCEGYEGELFRPDVLPKLRTATLLIETHDCFAAGVSDRLRAAFADTHMVREYGEADGRRAASVPLDFLSEAERKLAEHEVRPPQVWLLCLPRTGPNAALSQA